MGYDVRKCTDPDFSRLTFNVDIKYVKCGTRAEALELEGAVDSTDSWYPG